MPPRRLAGALDACLQYNSQKTRVDLAGSGVCGYAGDGGNAGSATLNSPTLLSWHAATGTLLVADTGNAAVRAITVAAPVNGSTTQRTIASLYDPGLLSPSPGIVASATVLDGHPTLRLALADSALHVIWGVAHAAGFTAEVIAGVSGQPGFAGDGGDATASRLNEPRDAAWAADTRTLYIADHGNNRIRALTPAGVGYNISTIAGSGVPSTTECAAGPALTASVSPAAVLYYQNGSNSALIIADDAGRCVRALTLTGSAFPTVTTLLWSRGTQTSVTFGSPPLEFRLGQPTALAHDPVSDALVVAGANQTQPVLMALMPLNSSSPRLYPLIPTLGGMVDDPSGLAYDPASQTLFVSDSQACLVSAITCYAPPPSSSSTPRPTPSSSRSGSSAASPSSTASCSSQASAPASMASPSATAIGFEGASASRTVDSVVLLASSSPTPAPALPGASAGAGSGTASAAASASPAQAPGGELGGLLAGSPGSGVGAGGNNTGGPADSSVADTLPAPMPVFAAASACGVLLCCALGAVIVGTCIFRRSLRRRRRTQRASVRDVAAADRLLAAQAAGLEGSAAYQIDALAAVLIPSSADCPGLEGAGVAANARKRLAAGALQELLAAAVPSAVPPHPKRGSSTPAAFAAVQCRKARVALLQDVQARLPTEAMEAVMLSTVEAAAALLTREREPLLGGQHLQQPHQGDRRTAVAQTSAAARSRGGPATGCLGGQPTIAARGDAGAEDADASCASSSQSTQALVDTAVAALMPALQSIPSIESSAKRGALGVPTTCAADAATAASTAEPPLPGLQPVWLPALASMGEAATVFLRSYHRSAAFSDASAPCDGSIVPLSALLSVCDSDPNVPAHAPGSSVPGSHHPDGRVGFVAVRPLCVARLRDRRAAAQRARAAAQPDEEPLSVDAEEGLLSEECAAELAVQLQPSDADSFVRLSSDGSVAAFSTTAASRRPASAVTSAVHTVALDSHAHKRSAQVSRVAAGTRAVLTTGLSDSALARRTVEALVVLSLDACAKRAGALAVERVLAGGAEGCVDGDEAQARVAVAAQLARVRRRLDSKDANKTAGDRSHSKFSAPAGGASQSRGRSRSSVASTLHCSGLPDRFSHVSPLHSPASSPLGDDAGLIDRLLRTELAAVDAVLQTAEAAARTLAWRTAVAALVCRRLPAQQQAAASAWFAAGAAGNVTASVAPGKQPVHRPDAALCRESPLLARMLQGGHSLPNEGRGSRASDACMPPHAAPVDSGQRLPLDSAIRPSARLAESKDSPPAGTHSVDAHSADGKSADCAAGSPSLRAHHLMQLPMSGTAESSTKRARGQHSSAGERRPSRTGYSPFRRDHPRSRGRAGVAAVAGADGMTH